MVPDGYGSHVDYMGWVAADADVRQQIVETALREAFSSFIEKREVEVVIFANMSALDLAQAIEAHPLILKSLLACCNIAARGIERDLAMKNLDTYSPRINEDHAKVMAGYIKPFLPPYLELPVLTRIDRVSYIDKEIRKGKGRWEKRILQSLNRYGNTLFRKRRFEIGGEQFELDAATPERGDILIAVDVKRIEARRDIHKRCDEILNKASKLKSAFSSAKFGAVLYYPFVDEQVNIHSRLRSPHIDGIVFASELDDSIENAVRLLLPLLK